MSKRQVVIPINQADSGCSAGGCPSASSCSSASSCESSGADDPSFRLQQEGWVLRTTIGEPRLSEIAENYQAMGQEVHIEYFKVPGSEPQQKICTTCFDTSGASQVWGSIYVRPGKPGQAKDDELF